MKIAYKKNEKEKKERKGTPNNTWLVEAASSTKLWVKSREFWMWVNEWMNKEREREEAQGVSFTFSLQEKTVIGRKRKKKKGVMQEMKRKRNNKALAPAGIIM